MSDGSAAASPSPSSSRLAVSDPDVPPLTSETWEGRTQKHVESLSRPDNATYTVRPPPTRFAGSDNDADAAVEMVKAQGETLRDFVERAPPAVFGRGMEEVYDPSIRNGRQLPADAFTTNIEPEMLRIVLQQIQSDLGLTVGIQAEPYSINLYEEGGLFESHKDTPRGTDMFGTLVLCLPSLFLGGALQVGMTQPTTQSFFGKHLDQSRIPFQENLSGDTTWWRTTYEGGEADDGAGPVAIPWCAFFSDADHRVTPVRKGVRVALSYLLRRTDDGGSSSGADGLVAPRTLAKEDEQLTALVEAFQSIKSSPFNPKVRVGFPCDHLYTTSEVWPHKDRYYMKEDDEEVPPQDVNRMTPDTVGRLKGRDALVARAATAVGLQVFLMPFLNSWGGDYFIADFEADFIADINGAECDSLVDAFYSLGGMSVPPPEWFSLEERADTWIQEHRAGAGRHKGTVGYLGNGPPEIEEYYLYAALLVEPFPPCTFRFTTGESSRDVTVDFAKDQTLRDVLQGARRDDAEGGLVSDPLFVSALDSTAASEGGEEKAPPSLAGSLQFEIQGALGLDPKTKNSVVTYGPEEFFSMIPALVAGRVPAGTDPVVVAVRVDKKRGFEESTTKLPDD